MVRAGAVDLGSNLIRLAVGESQFTAPPRVLHKEVAVARIAQGLGGKGGDLNPDAVSRAIACLDQMRSICDRFESSIESVVATGALRLARNRDAVVARIAAETGLAVEIIEGEREARLSLRGVQSQLGTGAILLVDIGGTTTEVVRCDDAQGDARSFEIGVITLTEWAASARADEQALRARAAAVFADLAPAAGPARPCFAAGGAAVALTAWQRRVPFLQYIGTRDDVLGAAERARIYADFRRATSTERAQRLGVSEDHAALVPAGYAILDAVLRRLGVEDVHPTGRGVVEGLLAEILA